MLGPYGRVFIAPHFGPGGQLEEGEHIPHAGVEKDVHVGVGFAGGRHGVLGDRQHQLHVEVVLVPARGFERVLAAIGDVVNFLDKHVFLLVRTVRSDASAGDSHRVASKANASDRV